jgi:NAD(P)-dependent dehydrogenase (short-subunit alcohol dehydrogenase family)
VNCPTKLRAAKLLTTGFEHRFGRINVLVNNASKQKICQEFAAINLDDVESVFRSNVLQMFAMTKYALPHMTKGDSYVELSPPSKKTMLLN